MILCYVKGKTQLEAATELGWSAGELRGRLNRGRRMLRARLQRRGWAGPSVVRTLAALGDAGAAPPLRRAVLEAAARLGTGEPPEGLTPPEILSLMKGAVSAMLVTKLRAPSAALVLAAAAALGLSAVPTQADLAAPAGTQPPAGGKAETPQAGWRSLFEAIDPDGDHRIGQGIWRLRDGKLIGYPAAHGARLRIPLVPVGVYEVRSKWEPRSHDSSIHLTLPHGDRLATVEILTRQDYAGLGDLNGVRPDVNETRRDVKIEAGKTYLLWARMSYTEDQIHVIAKLDDETVIDWEGKRAEVDDPYFAPPKPAALGLAVSGDASTFHSLELRMIDGDVKQWKPATPGPGALDPIRR